MKFTSVFNIRFIGSSGTLGLALRLFGLDFAFMFLFMPSDWVLVEFSLIPNRFSLLYFQFLIASMFVGRSDVLYG